MASVRGPVGADGEVNVQGEAVLERQGSFDMWHDYLNLDPLLKKRSGMDRPNPTGSPWGHIQSWRREDDGVLAENNSTDTNSADMSSLSSLSDTCSSSSGATNRFCGFCHKNGETVQVYRSHRLKSADGKVTCPILWSYTCPVCAATGEDAHTRRYCPQAGRQNSERKTWPHQFW